MRQLCLKATEVLPMGIKIKADPFITSAVSSKPGSCLPCQPHVVALLPTWSTAQGRSLFAFIDGPKFFLQPVLFLPALHFPRISFTCFLGFSLTVLSSVFPHLLSYAPHLFLTQHSILFLQAMYYNYIRMFAFI